MINLVIPITENLDGFAEFIKKHNDKHTKIYVGLTETLHKEWKAIPGVEVHVYKNESNREEILNALHKIPKKKGTLFVVRRPLTDEEYTKLLSSYGDIATLKQKHNKFVNFFKNLARTIIRKIFAFSYFEDISAVRYHEEMHELVESFQNISMASRINRYVGLEVDEIETDQKPAQPLYDKFYNAMWLTLAILFFVASVFDGVLIFIIVPNIWALYAILIIAWWVVALAILCAVLIKFTRTVAVGDINIGTAIESEEEKPFVVEEKTETTKTAEQQKKKTATKKTAAKKEQTKPAQATKRTQTKKASTEKVETTTKKRRPRGRKIVFNYKKGE